MVYVEYHSNGLELFKPNVSIKSSIPETLTNDRGVPQGSVLGSLLVLIYIMPYTKLHNIQKCIILEDNTNLLYSSKSLKDINQKINFELKNIAHWLRANKISLDIKKTETALFRAQKTIIIKNTSFRISGQKTNIMKETKDFEMVMDEHLNFENHMDTVKLKLNLANGLLAKLRHYVNPVLLRTIHFAIFESHLQYGCQLCWQTQTQVLQNIEKIESKVLRIIKFKNSWEASEKIFKEPKIF